MACVSPTTVTTLRASLPRTASACVEAIVNEVAGYDREFDARLRANIEGAVGMALAAFLDALEEGSPRDSAAAMRTGAYRLGQGEAEAGRSTDALLSAYRVGAREAWSQFATIAVDEGEDAPAIAELAAGTFTFIDDLSAQSLAGHTSAMSARTHELARRRDQLATALVSGENRAALERLAEGAHWSAPRTLAALAVVGDVPTRAQSVLGDTALWARTQDEVALVLVPNASARTRSHLLTACAPSRAAFGPAVPWHRAAESATRARRALRFARPGQPADADDLLPELLLEADPLVAARLRDRALAPLAETSPAKREILTETLLAWLLQQGRREDVAASLHVHPQTVRYRMNTLRELYGERLTDPRAALELVLGLLGETTREKQAR